jgi:hypothetical protein
MIDDMAVRSMSPNMQKVYAYVPILARFPPPVARPARAEHARDYRLHLMSCGLKASSIHPTVRFLRSFYGTTLGNTQLAEISIGRIRGPRFRAIEFLQRHPRGWRVLPCQRTASRHQ